MNDLLLIKTETALEVFSNQESIIPYLDEIKREVSLHAPDVTTAKGRKEIASLANRVAKTKVYLDDLGKDLVSDWKEKSKKVDATRKLIRDELDALKIEARKPLTEWEEEQARIEAEIKAEQARLELLKQIEADHEIAILLNEKFDREKAEELARVEAERIEREKAREVQIREQMRLEQEQKEKALQEQLRRAEEEKRQAEIRAEAEKIAAIEREKQAKEREIEAAKQAKIAAEQAAEAARIAEIERQKREIEAAERKQAELEANRAHVSNVRKEIKEHIMKECGIDEALAVNIVKSLIKCQRVSINY